MRGLYRSSVSAAPLTVRNGTGEEAPAAGEQAAEKKLEVLELADGFRIAVPGGPSVTEEEQQRQKQQKPAVHIEKVVNAWGSAAGAGSDFFDCYRRTRNVEMRRLEKMDEDFRKKLEMEEFQLRRHQRMEETLKKNAAARERRRRRKVKQQEQQRLRLDNKKSTPGSAADGGAAGSSAVGSCSRSATRDSEGSDTFGRTSAEAQTGAQEARRSRGERNTSLHSPSGSDGSEVSDDAAEADAFEKRRRRHRTQGSAGIEEDPDPGSSGESDQAESDAREENSKKQTSVRRKRRRGEEKDQHSSSTAYTRQTQSHDEMGGGQLRSSAGSTQHTGHIKVEHEERKEHEEDTHIPMMKEGMITVHDGDW